MSTWMILVIALGAVFVAIGNIQYQRASSAENRQAKADQVRALLRPELQINWTKLGQAHAAFDKDVTWVGRFDTTAWQTVAGAELLFGLPDAELSALLEIYRLLNQANANLARLEEQVVGVAAAMTGSKDLARFWRRESLASLWQLRTKFDELPRSIIPSPAVAPVANPKVEHGDGATSTATSS